MIGMTQIALDNAQNIVAELDEERLVQPQLRFLGVILLLGIAGTQLRGNGIAGGETVNGKDDENNAQHDRDDPQQPLENKFNHGYSSVLSHWGYMAVPPMQSVWICVSGGISRQPQR